MHIKKYVLALGLSLSTVGLALGLSGGAFAQATAEGVVRRIDLDNNKISIRHGEIKALDMPPMTIMQRMLPLQIMPPIHMMMLWVEQWKLADAQRHPNRRKPTHKK